MKKKKSTDLNGELYKEVYKFIKRKRSEKFTLIGMILEELESEYNFEIEEFEYKNKRLSVKVGKNNWVCVDLSEDI